MAYQTYVLSACQQMLTYMANVAAANADLNIGVYMGIPTEADGIIFNTMSLGVWSEGGGTIVTGFNSSWRSLGGASASPVQISQNNPFSIHWSVVAYAGSDGGNPATSPALLNANTMFNGMVTEILGDPKGSGNLGPNGIWNTINMNLPFYGPAANGGVQVVLECVVGVSAVNIGVAN